MLLCLNYVSRSNCKRTGCLKCEIQVHWCFFLCVCMSMCACTYVCAHVCVHVQMNPPITICHVVC